MAKEYVFKLEVTGRPESSGIRVRSLNPVGFYASCKDRGALTNLAGVALLHLARTRKLLGPESEGPLTITDVLNWDDFLTKGEGSVAVIAVHPSEIHADEYIEPVRSEYSDAVLDMIEFPDGRSLFIVRDQIDIDEWILDRLDADKNQPS